LHEGAEPRYTADVRSRAGLVATVLALTITSATAATTWEQQSGGKRALYTSVAAVANVVPVVSTLYAPHCLPGYVLCKAVYAFISVVGAGGQLALSGGQDLEQTRAILHRGFAGDWYLTGRHVSGEINPEVLPEPPPRSGGGGGEKWEPPPL
jgi:hypothetical protein